MNAIMAISAGVAGGTVAGAIAGHDLVRSVSALTASRPRLTVVFGLIRRMGIFAGTIVASIAGGPACLVGAAFGYLGGFSVIVVREVRGHVG